MKCSSLDGHSRSSSALQHGHKQILPAGRPLLTMLWCPKRLMFYLRPHLKDLSVTLIRARCECLTVFCVNLKALRPRQPRFIGKKSGYICSCNLLPDPTSWCQLIICPLNLIRFSSAKTAAMENRALHTNTRSYAMTVRFDKTHTCIHEHKQVPAGQCAKSDTAPSHVIPSNHRHFAT